MRLTGRRCQVNILFVLAGFSTLEATLALPQSLHTEQVKVSGCIFDKENPSPEIKILDPKDGIPFINVEGALQKTRSILENFPKYKLEKVAGGRHDIFDLKLQNDYLALFDDGTLGFAPSSSQGPLPRSKGRKQYISSIFALSCDGDLSISLPEVPTYGFSRSNITDLTYIHHTPATTSQFNRYNVHKRAPHVQFIKRTMSMMDIENAQMESFSFLIGPTIISDKHQRGGAPRCWKTLPFGLTAVERPGARPASFNGCGAENGMKVPDWRFEQCCNEHDLCYDDCSATWETCNDNFRQCNHDACTKAYPLAPVTIETNRTSWIPSMPDWSLTRWGCHTLGQAYAEAVDTGLGRVNFNASTIERCTCRCPDKTFDCGNFCMLECEPINEEAVVPTNKGLPLQT
ncbi:hypothetical protein BT63DRAFT_476221 [Microthyrium microscopicum]|uniref:Phospholipase A2 n=1 Tax=Microthyrium microscopicum TaxID=703497 RepID=A0A6A6UQN0_9PEZI|nr:hypothetical protein BT63DRAFT_476221 [Microthyrium microscopicum]